MAEATTLIANQTAADSTSKTIIFGSIPGTYDDLLVMGSGHGTTTSVNPEYMDTNFNADTTGKYSWGMNYAYRGAYKATGDTDNSGGGVTAIRVTCLPSNGSNSDTVSAGGWYMYIPQYANTSYKKTGWYFCTGMTDATTWAASSTYGAMTGWAGMFTYDSTSAITEIQLKCLFGNFAEHSSYDLYGIKNS
mgnify:CR=1 FL=1